MWCRNEALDVKSVVPRGCPRQRNRHIIKVRHTGGVVTMYAHLARAFVKRGEIVTAREIIGRAGCTGSCTGTHLHFQAWRHGKLIDPLELLGRHAFDRL